MWRTGRDSELRQLQLLFLCIRHVGTFATWFGPKRLIDLRVLCFTRTNADL